MENLKILVACHKPFNIHKDSIHIPIHVGRAVSTFKAEMADMLGDDTGDNISEKNPFYCEMTAQYWAWKNIHDVEYIGFCHYRKYFEDFFKNNNINNIFKSDTDVILAGPVVRNWGRYNFLKEFVCSEDIAIMLYVIKKQYPDYLKTISEYAYGYKDYPMNMLICRKSLFDDYAKWIFDILFECEKYIKLSPYSRARRVFGYISEFLMPIYFLHNHHKIKTMNYVDEEGKVRKDSLKSFIKMNIIHKLMFFGIKKPILSIDSAVKLGLKNDFSKHLFDV